MVRVRQYPDSQLYDAQMMRVLRHLDGEGTIQMVRILRFPDGKEGYYPDGMSTINT